MVIYNLLATGMLFVAVMIGGLIAHLMGRFQSPKSPVFLLGTGIVLIIVDLWYRATRGEGSYFHPRRGGQYFFIPVWIIGMGLVVFNFFLAILDEADVSARQTNPHGNTSVAQKSSKPAAFFAPQPSYQSLKLGMISGVGSNRIATINGQPFAQGESHALTFASTKRVVQCTEIRDQSVVLKVSGDSQPCELKFGEPQVQNRW